MGSSTVFRNCDSSSPKVLVPYTQTAVACAQEEVERVQSEKLEKGTHVVVIARASL